MAYIAGRIIDSRTSTGIVGATVTVTNTVTGNVTTKNTALDGSFEFTETEIGDDIYEIGVTANPLYSGVRVRGLIRGIFQNDIPLNLRRQRQQPQPPQPPIPPPQPAPDWGRIQGRVIDTTGNPINDATVTNGEDSDRTRNGGQYELNGRSGRSYLISAQADGYSQGSTRSPPVIGGGVVNAPDIILTLQTRGRVRGRVIDDETRTPIPESDISIEGPDKSTFRTPDGNFESYLTPGNYKIKAKHSQYEDGESNEISLEAGKTETAIIRLKRKGGVKKAIKTGIPIFSGKWWKDNRLRGIIALGFTLFIYLVFYRPIVLAGLGFYDPFTPPWWFLQFFVPLGFFFILLFAMPKDMKKIEDWGPLILSILVFIAVFGSSFIPPFRFLGASRTIRFGVPFILALITFYIASKDAKAGKGLRPMIIHITSIMLLLGILLFGINLVISGALLKIDTYLRPLDILRIIGVPQENIDSIKDGVRNVLSFLQFKGAEQEKPEAKKIGGFEAIQLKFGSVNNNFVLPTLFARVNYTLPITVTNPNKFATQLVVKNFTISDVFLDNRSSERILCGSTTDGKGKIELGDIQPEDEKLTTIDFENRSNCIDVLEYKSPRPTNPMFPAKVTVDVKKEDKDTQCKDNNLEIHDTDTVCVNLLQSFYNRYFAGGQVPVAISKNVSARYINSENTCECKLNRYYNIMDELCFMDNDKARIELKSNYDFKVQGKGELLFVKTETDRKLAPKPTITSSAGPLTVTTYFVSDVHIFEPTSAPKATKMFIQIENAGDGSAKITGVSINEKNASRDLPIYLGSSLGSDKINVTRCSPDPADLSVGTEPISAVCDVAITESPSFVTGSYRTVPVIVDVNYTYSQTHSTTVNVKKETIPEDVTNDDQIRELDNQFKVLPYYCPNEKSESISGGTPVLIIYNTVKSP